MIDRGPDFNLRSPMNLVYAVEGYASKLSPVRLEEKVLTVVRIG